MHCPLPQAWPRPMHVLLTACPWHPVASPAASAATSFAPVLPLHAHAEWPHPPTQSRVTECHQNTYIPRGGPGDLASDAVNSAAVPEHKCTVCDGCGCGGTAHGGLRAAILFSACVRRPEMYRECAGPTTPDARTGGAADGPRHHTNPYPSAHKRLPGGTSPPAAQPRCVQTGARPDRRRAKSPPLSSPPCR